MKKLVEPSSELVSDASTAHGRASFQTTQWAMVLQAGDAVSAQADVALEELCQLYWRPVYVYVRRRGYRSHDAQDLTQEFFTRLLRRKSLESVAPNRGKFRSFLLASLKNFLADAWDAATAEKRGGSYRIISLDCDAVEEQFESSPEPSPDAAYDRRWTQTLLERALVSLRQEWTVTGKAPQFERLKSFLSNPTEEGDYDHAARDIGMTTGAVAVAVHRLRQRCRDVVRTEIARTVSTPEELDEELRYLFGKTS